jgi:hypothetical protein
MGALRPALEFIFQVQRKRNNEKIERRKVSFATHKTHFFFVYFLFEPLLLSKLQTFSFLVHFKRLKC